MSATKPLIPYERNSLFEKQFVKGIFDTARFQKYPKVDGTKFIRFEVMDFKNINCVQTASNNHRDTEDKTINDLRERFLGAGYDYKFQLISVEWKGNGYEVSDGHHRYEALQGITGVKKIPVGIVEHEDDAARVRWQCRSNNHAPAAPMTDLAYANAIGNLISQDSSRHNEGYIRKFLTDVTEGKMSKGRITRITNNILNTKNRENGMMRNYGVLGVSYNILISNGFNIAEKQKDKSTFLDKNSGHPIMAVPDKGYVSEYMLAATRKYAETGKKVKFVFWIDYGRRGMKARKSSIDVLRAECMKEFHDRMNDFRVATKGNNQFIEVIGFLPQTEEEGTEIVKTFNTNVRNIENYLIEHSPVKMRKAASKKGKRNKSKK